MLKYGHFVAEDTATRSQDTYNPTSNSDSTVTLRPDTSGVYFVAASSHLSPRNDLRATGSYTLEVSVVPDDDYSANKNTTGAVTVGTPSTGEIEKANDRDWFAATLNAGTTYRVRLKGKFTGDGSLSDPYLRGIHNADGEKIPNTSNDGSTRNYNSLVVFTPDQTGTYYIAAGADGSWELGTYTLLVLEE